MIRPAALAMVLALLLAPGADARKHRKHSRSRAGHASLPAAFAARPLVLPVKPVAVPLPTVTAGPAVTEPVPTATATPTPTASPTVPTANPHSVSVRGTEYALTLSQKTVDPGELKVQFDLGRAEDDHVLDIAGADPDDFWDFGNQTAGTVEQHTITVRSGTYTLFCPLPQHEAKGMHATLTVR